MSMLCALAIGLAALQQEGLKIGDVVPDLELKTIDGKALKLSDLRGEKGKVVVIFFQSEKCPTAVPPDAVKKIADRYAGDKSDVRFVSVFAYHKDGEEATKKFCEASKLSHPCVHDKDKKIAKHFGATKVNTTYVLDKQGKLAYRGVLLGKKGKEVAAEAVQAVLKGAPVPSGEGRLG